MLSRNETKEEQFEHIRRLVEGEDPTKPWIGNADYRWIGGLNKRPHSVDDIEFEQTGDVEEEIECSYNLRSSASWTINSEDISDYNVEPHNDYRNPSNKKELCRIAMDSMLDNEGGSETVWEGEITSPKVVRRYIRTMRSKKPVYQFKDNQYKQFGDEWQKLNYKVWKDRYLVYVEVLEEEDLTDDKIRKEYANAA